MHVHPGRSGARARLARPDRRRHGRAARRADAAVLLHGRLGGARACRVQARRRAAAGAGARAACRAGVRGREQLLVREPERDPLAGRPHRQARGTAGRRHPARGRDRPRRCDRRLDRACRVAGAGAGAAQGPRLRAPARPGRRHRARRRLRLGGGARPRGAQHPPAPGRPARRPAARVARGRRERAARAHDRRRRHAHRERFVWSRCSPGVSSGHAFLPASRRRSAQAPHPVPRQRHPAHRRGDGARGLHRQRVDPLPPPVALPRAGDRRVRADRAGGVGAGHPPAPDDAHQGRRAGRRRGHRPPAPDVERGRRDLALPAHRADGVLLPERRRGRGDLRPRGLGDARDDLRRAPVQGGRLRRHPARHDVPLPAAKASSGT